MRRPRPLHLCPGSPERRLHGSGVSTSLGTLRLAAALAFRAGRRHRLLAPHPMLQLVEPYRLFGGGDGIGERKSTRSGGSIRSAGGVGKAGQRSAAAGATGIGRGGGAPQLQSRISPDPAAKIGNALLIVTAHLLCDLMLRALGPARALVEPAGLRLRGAARFGAEQGEGVPLARQRRPRVVALAGADREQDGDGGEGGDREQRRPAAQREGEDRTHASPRVQIACSNRRRLASPRTVTSRPRTRALFQASIASQPPRRSPARKRRAALDRQKAAVPIL